MENVRKISKMYYLRQIMACWLACWMLFGIPVQIAMATPMNAGNIVVDNHTPNVSFDNTVSNVTTVTAPHQAIINYNHFNVDGGKTLHFAQSSVTDAVMNRIIEANPSSINGNLTALGRVFIINPAGIVFGGGATVNVAQLVASGLRMTDDAFKAVVNNVNAKMVFSGGGGDVEILGTLHAEETDSLYFVGHSVLNSGAILCPDGLVVMAAGDTVQLGQPGSNVIVDVANLSTDLVADIDNKVRNDGQVGDTGSDRVRKLVLAAGDVWSAAIDKTVEQLAAVSTGDVYFDGDIHAYDNGGSDAVADVTIITGGDLTVEGYTITAEADAEGVPDTDAIATVSITADGDVKVNADGTFTSALIEAKAENGEKNEAKVNIESTNGDVTVESEGMYEWAVIKAEAEDGIENIADITIAADGDVKVTNQGGIVFIFPDIDSALIEALAHEGTTNTAGIDITAGDIVEVVSNEFSFGALVRAEAWNEIKLDPDIPAPVADEVVVVDLDAIEGLVNTATVDITATTVEIRGEKAGNAAVEAIARNDIEVDIDNDEGDNVVDQVIVNLTVADLQNNAGVTITANNKETADYDDGDVRVTAKSLGDAGIKADAYNEIEIKHHKKADNPVTMNLTLDGLANTADVVINADDDVEVTAENWRSTAEISAEAWNKLEVVESYKGGDTTVNLTVDDLRNNAGIDITTAVDSVMVSGLFSGEARIRAAAWNKLEIDEYHYKGGETTLRLAVDGLVRNTADVVIDAEIDVEVKAECEGDCSEASIEAVANNLLDDVDNLLLVEADALVENNAGIDITAGEDVRVIGIDCGEATIAAVAENEVDLTVDGLIENNADVVINAGDDVLVQAVGGKHGYRGFTPSQASIEAVTDVATDNDADVTIGATNVEVTAESGGDAGIGATAQHALNENNADVTITTSGDVKVKASGVGSGPPSEAAIEAYASQGNNNNAGVTIDAGGNVEVAGGVDDRRGIAGIVATAMFATNNTADVTITADNVKLISGNVQEGYKGTAEIIAEAKNAFGPDSKNDADVTITTDGDVLVHGGTSDETAAIRAVAASAYNNDADILINASGNVEVKAGDDWYEHRGKAEIVAEAGSGHTNTADVTINAGGDVTVIDLYGGGETAKIKARASEADYADAAVTINAENVTVTGDDDGGGHAEISAFANGLFNADATVDITLTGSDLTVGNGGSIYADAYTRGPEAILGVAENGPETRDATAEVTINADGQVTVEENGRIYTDAEVRIDYPDVWGDLVDDPVLIPGDATATTTINADDGVTIERGGQINADARIQYNYHKGKEAPYVVDGPRPDAIANVDIQTCGNVIVDGLIMSNAQINRNSYPENLRGDATADVIVKAYGDVIVNSEDGIDNGDGSNGRIVAEAQKGLNNSAGVTVLTVGDVIVNNGSAGGNPRRGFIYSPEEILASAHGTYDNGGYTNNAFVHIATREGFAGNVEVSGQISANTYLAGGEGDLPPSNTSNVEIYADQDVIVNGGYAKWGSLGYVQVGPMLLDAEEGGQIMAGAGNGPINTANVDIYAGRDVIVHGAEIEYSEPIPNNHLTQGNGGGYYDAGQIVALTWGSGGGDENGDLGENTSSIGIYAQDDVTIHDATIIGEPPVIMVIELNGNGGPQTTTDGQVLAAAHGEDNILDADIVICAQDDVTIDGEVRAEAGTTIDPDNEHYADIAISAGDDIAGTGWIYAEADPSAKVAKASIVLRTPDAGNILIEISDEHFGIMDHDNPKGDGLPDIDIGPVDCPECDFDWIDWSWCEECEVELLLEPPPAPLYTPASDEELEGCGTEIVAVANLLGVTEEGLRASFAAAPGSADRDLCDTCARFLANETVLDIGGTQLAALGEVVNEFVTTPAPPSEEQMALIAATMASHAGDDTHYATAGQYLDALAEYVGILNTEIGLPADEAAAFVATKVAPIENAGLAAYVQARLAALGG